MVFKRFLAVFLVSALVLSMASAAQIIDGDNVAFIQEDPFTGGAFFNDSEMWTAGTTSFSGDTVILNDTGVGKLGIDFAIMEYNTSNYDNRNITISTRMKLTTTVGLTSSNFFGFGAGNGNGGRAVFYMAGPNTINIYSSTHAFYCNDIADAYTLTDYNLFQVILTSGNATYWINGDRVCTHTMDEGLVTPYLEGGLWVGDTTNAVTIDYFNYSNKNRAPSIDSVLATPDPVNVTGTVDFFVNWTDVPSDSVKIEVCKTDSLTGVNCTSSYCNSDSTWDASSPTGCSYVTTGADVGVNNYYAFVCDDDDECSASTSGTFTVESILSVNLLTPLNATYWTSNLTFSYIVNSTETEPYDCSYTLQSVDYTNTSVLNATVWTEDFFEYNASTFTIDLNCNDGAGNVTDSVTFTVNDTMVEIIETDPAYETTNQTLEVWVRVNPDIVKGINATLYWNGTYQGYDNRWQNYTGAIVPSPSHVNNYMYNQSVLMPLVATNTTVNYYWNYTQILFNSTLVEANATDSQTINPAYFTTTTISPTTQMLENTNLTFSSTITNLTINLADIDYWTTLNNTNSTGVYNDLTGTNNQTAPKLENSSTNKVWSTWFNLSFNGAHRLITNTGSINVHQSQIGPCADVAGAFAVNWTMLLEETEEAINSSLQFETVTINHADGTTTDFHWGQQGVNLTANTSQGHSQNYLSNYSMCILPAWAELNVTMTTLYARNSTSIDPREYYLYQALITNQTQTVNLYNYDGDRIDFTILDGSQDPYVGAYIKLQRLYPDGGGGGTYETVAMCLTDANGQDSSYASVAADNNQVSDYYRLVIERDGEVVKSISPVAFTEYNNLGYALKSITIDEGGAGNTYWDIEGSLSGNFGLTNDSGNVTFYVSVNDASGLMTSATLAVKESNLYGNATIFEDTIYTSSGTILVNVGNVTDRQFFVTATGVFSGETYLINSSHYSWVPSNLFSSSDDAALVWFLITGTMMFVGIFNPSASLIMGLFGLGAGVALGITALAWGSVMAIVVAGVILLVVINR